MGNQLQKAINLAKKTGDRLLVFESPTSDNGYVVMSLDEYEKISVSTSEVRGLTEDELLDKMNRDIAVWKSEQGAKNDHEIDYSFSSDEGKDFSLENKKRKSPWAIPEDRKEAAEEIIEEDRQYLEEIRF